MKTSIIVSVIIATKDRAEALRSISLPSLLRQDSSEFEVIVWDASDDDSSKVSAEYFIPRFGQLGIDLIYYRAPRKGSASQRNDAVNNARGDVVFFIDDDCEVSNNSISSLISAFSSFDWLMGCGLPMSTKTEDAVSSRRNSVFVNFARSIMYILRGGRSSYRKIAPSTYNISAIPEVPGFAEYLSGGSMAFRRRVFDDIRFNERLERLSGYAAGEDYDFSHRVFLKYRTPLLVANGGLVIHRPAAGGRPNKPRFVAATFYNSRIIRDGFNKYTHYGLFPFLWGMRVCRALGFLLSGYSPIDIFRGWRMYRKALREDNVM